MTKSKKVILVTGGNSGLGLECARNIAAKSNNYHILLACRNGQKANAAIKYVIDQTDNANISTMELDVSSLSSVRSFVKKYKQHGLGPLEGIICNAGINGTYSGLTSDGFDMVFETNHLGHFLLTNLLLPHLQPNGRVAIVSSDMHCPPGGELTWSGVEALAYPSEEFSTNFSRYSFSKLCNLYFTYELAAKLKRLNSHITANAFNPGLLTDTNFSPDKSRFTEEFLAKVADRIGTLNQSAMALANMMTEAQYEQITGKYVDRGMETLSSSLSYDKRNAKELWEKSVEYTRLSAFETLPGILTI
ncbi:SDR family NAD(P)-dependent oxidoreductase [Gottfriedia sp. NPDC056225]|uniref:SDR family NAD(P)-dependent oxidoreductase n=1 Tax=Gottfriedia sp. NPDC056225 TaxID=3345751 RepID=UPI0035DEF22E